MDQFGAVGGHVVAHQLRIDNVAVFLGIRSFAENRTFDIGVLGDENVFSDAGLGLDDGVAAQGSTLGNRQRV